MHGGAAPQVRTKAAERVVEQAARRELGKLAAVLGPAEPIDNPLTELGKLAGEVIRWKDLMAEHVAELDRIRYSDDRGGEQLRSEISLFERALDRCGTFLTSIARLNIDARLAAISEAQADVVLRAIDAALDDAGVESARRGQAKLAAARHLKAVP